MAAKENKYSRPCWENEISAKTWRRWEREPWGIVGEGHSGHREQQVQRPWVQSMYSMPKEKQGGPRAQYRVPRKRFVGDDTRSGGLAFSIENQTDCTSYLNLEKDNHLDLSLINYVLGPLPTPAQLHSCQWVWSHSLFGYVTFESPLSYSWPSENPHFSFWKSWSSGLSWLATVWATLRVSVALFLYSQLSDSCLWRLGFLSWKVGWGKNPNVLVFLMGLSISPQDI